MTQKERRKNNYGVSKILHERQVPLRAAQLHWSGVPVSARQAERENKRTSVFLKISSNVSEYCCAPTWPGNQRGGQDGAVLSTQRHQGLHSPRGLGGQGRGRQRERAPVPARRRSRIHQSTAKGEGSFEGGGDKLEEGVVCAAAAGEDHKNEPLPEAAGKGGVQELDASLLVAQEELRRGATGHGEALQVVRLQNCALH